MPTIKLLALLSAICLSLSGCGISGELENQAYVLVLGVDRLPDGQLGLTARVPKIGKSDKSQDEGGASSPYLTFSVSGASWAGAREALEWATPRRVNLSHIEMLVVSRALAEENGFAELLSEIHDTPHLYATTRLTICEGAASAFVDAGETIIGTRMSSELRAMLEHYADQGYIPDTTLADVCFAANSIYADPVAIYAAVEEDTATDPAGRGSVRILESPTRQRFLGASLLRKGVFVQALTLPQSQLLSLILGRIKSLPIAFPGGEYELFPRQRSAVSVDINHAGEALLRVSVRLNARQELAPQVAAALSEELKSSMESLIRACQSLRCDPFGFADRAAGHFITLQSWLDYDWRERYAQAEVAVEVEVAGNGAK